jgi:hypothetical protein
MQAKPLSAAEIQRKKTKENKASHFVAVLAGAWSQSPRQQKKERFSCIFLVP